MPATSPMDSFQIFCEAGNSRKCLNKLIRVPDSGIKEFVHRWGGKLIVSMASATKTKGIDRSLILLWFANKADDFEDKFF